jgi:hypothetical protein
MTTEKLKEYGFKHIALVQIVADCFKIEILDEDVGLLERCVYAFVVGNEIVRVGSSKAPLRKRLREWERDVTNALMGNNSRTPPDEANGWKDALSKHKVGSVFARQGTVVTTPVGTFNSYLDEESILIGRYRPRFCNNFHR